MKHSITLIFVVLFSFKGIAQENAQSLTQFVNEVDRAIPNLLNDFIVPGAAIALIEDGDIVLQKAYGHSNIKKGTQVTTQTGFNIGSISKTIAAWGVLKLVEEGRIELDAPAENYLTRWHLPESEYDVNQVTIRRLLSHTAGLSLHGYPGWSPKDKLPTIEESLNGTNNGPGRVEMIMEPGTKWKYSGGGFSILQLIVEEVTGQRFEDYMQTNVLDPLGMTNSSYTIDDQILKASSLEHNEFGEVIDFELFTAQAAAGLHTTIEDFTRFAMASLYGHKKNGKYNQVLSAKTIQQMMEPAPASDGSYGLGYSVDTINDTDLVLRGHGGANTGWHAFLRVDPVKNDGFLMITNGGAGHNIYRQIYCDWIYWKTGKSMGPRCDIKPSIASKLKNVIDHEGIENLVSTYTMLKETQADKYSFSEGDLNNLGYYYMGNDKLEAATAIFKLNVQEFPKSFNVYDSYGEALLEQGLNDKAIKNYKKSIELNPGNDHGIQVLKGLGINTDDIIKEISVDESILEKLVGKYEFNPDFAVTITRNGHQMQVQPTGQPKYDIFPASDYVYYLKVVQAQLTFNLSDDKMIESVTLFQGGQEMVGTKLE